MLKNILVTSFRNFFRNRSFSLINLIGLSVSMSLAMLIIMIMKEQYAFDNFHANGDRIYRINTRVVDSEWGAIDFANTPLSVGRVLKDDYTLVENVVRINGPLVGDAVYSHVKVPVKGLFVEPSFLDVFNFPLQRGGAATALVQPNSLVLTEQTAKKIFGTTEAVGQTLTIGRYGEFTVTGVLQETDAKSHLTFEMLCSMSTLPALEKKGIMPANLDDWSAYYGNYVYCKIKEGHDAPEIEQALAEINHKYCKGLKADNRDFTYDFYLHALKEITPGPELSGQLTPGMPASLLVFLGVLAGIVLLMSVFNFTNLMIAKSLSRAREIGVRKIVGAKRSQVFLQFVSEAVVFSFIALASSYVLLQFLKIGYFRMSLSKNLNMSLTEDFSLYIIFLVFAIVVGFIAGILPALYLSAFKVSNVLKDAQNLKVYSRLTFRKILMVAQFTLSVVFVIMVLVIYRQINFMFTADYGIEQKNTLNLDLQSVDFEKIANEVRSIPGVVRVGGVSHKLGTWSDGSANYKKDIAAEPLVMRHFMVDNNYIDNLSLTFVAGKNFNVAEQVGGERHVILNETAVNQLGFANAEAAMGQIVYASDTLMLQIVGVVKDFHFRPMHNVIGPLALRYKIGAISYLSARIHPGQQDAVTAALQTIWKRHDPNHPMELQTMENEIDEAYRETGMGDMLIIVGYIAFIAVSLACLGMLGMAMYAAQVRVKEVGVRKVMGASVKDVVMLLSKSYMVLIGIAVAIGVPVSVLLGNAFLDDFAYKIQISPVLVGLGVVIISGLGLLIVWSQ
ncbi:MAG: ABC transporter permease [Bacteroidota bacterium]